MAGIVGKLNCQILGKAHGSGPYTLVTAASRTPRSAGNPHTFLAISSSCLAQWGVGDALAVYIAYDPADIAAIEAAASVVDLLGTT